MVICGGGFREEITKSCSDAHDRVVRLFKFDGRKRSSSAEVVSYERSRNLDIKCLRGVWELPTLSKSCLYKRHIRLMCLVDIEFSSLDSVSSPVVLPRHAGHN